MRKRNYIKTGRTFSISLTRKLLIGVFILVALYFVSSLILGEMGVVKYYRMKKQYSSLNEEISQLKTDNAKLVKSVNALKTDPAYLERLARDKLGLARPGEIVYYYKEP
jgi:cell division protein FtsB